jgi:hypothetical protein
MVGIILEESIESLFITTKQYFLTFTKNPSYDNMIDFYYSFKPFFNKAKDLYFESDSLVVRDVNFDSMLMYHIVSFIVIIGCLFNNNVFHVDSFYCDSVAVVVYKGVVCDWGINENVPYLLLAISGTPDYNKFQSMVNSYEFIL